MTGERVAREAFEQWFAGLPTFRHTDGPARGQVAAALVVLDRLKEDYDLSIDSHTAKGGAQVRGLSAASVHKILRQHGENREYLKEGGRTNRSTRGVVSGLLDSLGQARLDLLSADARARILHGL